MAPKTKRAKGKTLKITEFNDNVIAEDVYTHFDDSWMTEEQVKEAKLAEKIGNREYSRTVNNALNEKESFRNTESQQGTVDELIAQLQAPYVAHFGNLRNGLSEELFLGLFHQDVVKTSRIVSQEGKTFAFVEFTTPDALALALLMDKTVHNGRQMHVNLASQKQVERLLDNGTGGTGSPASRGFGSYSRDIFGSNSNLPGSDPASPLSRDMFGSSAHETIELTRDIIGSANVPDSPASPLSFENWRSEIAVDSAGKGQEKQRAPGASWRSSDVVSPVTKESWRSEKVDKPDRKSWKSDEQPKRVTADGGSWRKNNESGSRSGKGSSAEGREASSDNRWNALRS